MSERTIGAMEERRRVIRELLVEADRIERDQSERSGPALFHMQGAANALRDFAERLSLES